MATIYIDDQALEVEEGENVLQAALEAGLDLPYFCWHPEMGSVGACRQCALVQFRDEEDTRGRIVMGCMTAVTEGARFSMKGESASEFRENIVESLMLNHPHDCPVCAEGGECHLQDMTVMVGHRDRRYRGKKNTHKNQYLGPLINHEMNRCISCYRCTRFYQDYAGGRDLAAHAAHDHVYFGRHEEGVLESEFAGNLVEVCPTGVFTDKPLVNDYTRKWDLQSAPSVCTGCSLGCNTMPGERYGKLKRVHNRYNNEVNGYFLCDRGRYGSDYVNDENRFSFAGLRDDDGRFNAVTAEHAINHLAELVGNGNTVGIGSPRASLETNHLLRTLVGHDNFCGGVADHEAALNSQIAHIMHQGSVTSPSLNEIEAADAILILGEDVSNTSPRMALSLRQSVRNKAKQMASEMRIPLWQDEAVRNLAQDQRSPLFIASISASRLDDIAEGTFTASSNEIARLGFAVAANLGSGHEVAELDPATAEQAQNIANALKGASKPLIVSGVACQNADIIAAASAIAEALQNTSNNQAMLSYCFAEANSLGSTLHSQQGVISLAEVCQRAENGQIDTLLIAENNLYRRAPSIEIDAVLSSVKNIVVLDCLDNATLSKSTLALPAAAAIEAEGTVVNNEGRAQRHYPVYLPSDDRSPSWQWLTRLGQKLQRAEFESIKNFDDVELACEQANPALNGMSQASPNHEFRNHGLKIPRQTHRYSGRTAMRADVSVHEPKQPVDNDSPLAFTMEGRNGSQPGALLPFVWSPGWNSNQSLHKFQAEIGGELRGGTAGKRLIEPTSANPNSSSAPPAKKTSSELHLEPSYEVFGSDELSARCDAIAELTPSTYVAIRTEDATSLGLSSGMKVTLNQGSEKAQAEVRVDANIAKGCAAYSVGIGRQGFFKCGQEIILAPISNGVAQENQGGSND